MSGYWSFDHQGWKLHPHPKHWHQSVTHPLATDTKSSTVLVAWTICTQYQDLRLTCSVQHHIFLLHLQEVVSSQVHGVTHPPPHLAASLPKWSLSLPFHTPRGWVDSGGFFWAAGVRSDSTVDFSACFEVLDLGGQKSSPISSGH